MSISALPTTNSFIVLYPQFRRPVTAREIGAAASAAVEDSLEQMFAAFCDVPLLAA
jgi:hypothetical protein